MQLTRRAIAQAGLGAGVPAEAGLRAQEAFFDAL